MLQSAPNCSLEHFRKSSLYLARINPTNPNPNPSPNLGLLHPTDPTDPPLTPWGHLWSYHQMTAKGHGLSKSRLSKGGGESEG